MKRSGSNWNGWVKEGIHWSQVPPSVHIPQPFTEVVVVDSLWMPTIKHLITSSFNAISINNTKLQSYGSQNKKKLLVINIITIPSFFVGIICLIYR